MTQTDVVGRAYRWFSSALVAGLVVGSISGAKAEDAKDTWISAILQNRCAEIVSTVRGAATANDPTALEVEAAMYDRGCGVVQNMRHATELYVEALAHGSKDALAEGYVDLYGPSPSEDEGISRLTQASEGGNRLAAFDLYFYYAHRLANRSDDAVAFHWASIAAHSGDVVAVAHLGGLYLWGTGVEQNIELGHQYADREVSANVPDALVVVGVATLAGTGGYRMDRAKGLTLLRKAISLGLTRAKIAIVQNVDKSDYADGRVTGSEMATFAQDAVALLEPRKYYDYQLGEYWYIGGGRDVPDCARALPLLLKVADINSYEPDYDIGYCYYHGDGVAQDDQLGFKYLKLAAQKGSPSAIAYLNSANSGKPGNNSNSTVDAWHNYEGYHWNELHPMSGQPATGPH